MAQRPAGEIHPVTLPENIWRFIDEHKKTDYLIRSRSDSIYSLLIQAYPELKVKQNETERSNQDS